MPRPASPKALMRANGLCGLPRAHPAGRGARVLAEGFAEMAGAGNPHGAGHFSHRAARRQQGAGGLHAPMRQARVHALAIQMLKARLQPFFIQAHLVRQRGGCPRLAAVPLQQGMGAAQRRGRSAAWTGAWQGACAAGLGGWLANTASASSALARSHSARAAPSGSGQARMSRAARRAQQRRRGMRCRQAGASAAALALLRRRMHG